MSQNAELIHCANAEKLDSIHNIFLKDPNINLKNVIDDKYFTLLHFACFQDNFEMVKMIIEYVQKQIKQNQHTDKNYLNNFVNLFNDDGFGAVHLAAYRGNLQIIQYLENQCGQEILKKHNPTGLCPMHTAAQGDNAIILAYLKDLGVDIDIQDDSGRTPLHWATYQGSETSALFLIAWGAKLDKPDDLIRMTPIHLAALGGSVKITKKLLLKGVNKNVKDEQGKTAYDIAVENEFKTITEMLTERSFIDKCLSVKQQLAPPKQYATQYKFFIILQALCFLFTALFVIPYVQSNILIYIFFIVSWIIVLMLSLSKQNPGKLKPHKKSSQKLYKRLQNIKNIDDFCPECEIIRPKRSRHCDICKSCIKVFDHHCPWINNCIGAKNHSSFYIMLVSVQIGMLYQLVLHSLYIKEKSLNTYAVLFQDEAEAHEMLFYTMHLIASIIVMLICAIFQIPLGALVYVQTLNLLKGKTTNEIYSQKMKQQIQQEEEDADESNTESFDVKTVSYSHDQQSTAASLQSQEHRNINTITDSIGSQDEDNLQENLLVHNDEEFRKSKKKRRNQKKQSEFSFDNCMEMCCANKSNNEFGLIQ